MRLISVRNCHFHTVVAMIKLIWHVSKMTTILFTYCIIIVLIIYKIKLKLCTCIALQAMHHKASGNIANMLCNDMYFLVLLDWTISWIVSHCDVFISLPSLHLITDIFTLCRRTRPGCVLVTVSCHEEDNHYTYDVEKYQYN